jgi:DNA-binding NarL/FixJ family response regulator
MTQACSTAVDELVCIAWIDSSRLTRECMTDAVAGEGRTYFIVPFDTVYDCVKAADRRIDLIVYHIHDTVSVNSDDIVALREAFGSTPLVILSDASSLAPAAIKEVLSQGVAGFILTSQTGLQMLVSALGLVVAGGTFVPKEYLLSQDAAEPSMTKERLPTHGRLTARERDVLALLKQGKPNKLIAHELNVSESTVKVHVRNTMRKTGTANRTEVAMNADRYLGARAA